MPAVFRLVADSTHVREARLVGWNLADDTAVTVLFAVDGDEAGVRANLPEVDGHPVRSAETAPLSRGRFALLLQLDASDTSVLGAVLPAIRQRGLVVVKPVVYRDGAVHARIVGETAAVQAFVDALPPVVDVSIHEIGSGGVDPTDPATVLSERQREALLAALDLGYYGAPKRATHEDVATVLGCASSTASEHLQRAEAKLVRAVLQSGFDTDEGQTFGNK